MIKKAILTALLLSCFSVGTANALTFGDPSDDSSDSSNDKYKVGIDYDKLSSNPNPSFDGTVNVINFFSYGCAPCVDVTKKMNDWKQTMPYYVQMNDSPVSPSIKSSYPARIYFALDELKMLNLNIPLLETSVDGKTDFSKFDILTAWLSGRGVTTDSFKSAFDSKEVLAKVYSSPDIIKMYNIDSIPMISINGEYEINSKEIEQHKSDLTDLVNFLVQKSRDENEKRMN